MYKWEGTGDMIEVAVSKGHDDVVSCLDVHPDPAIGRGVRFCAPPFFGEIQEFRSSSPMVDEF